MNNTVYFDNAATTYPKPECVLYESYRCMREYCGNSGRGSNRMAMASSEAIYKCRQRIKELFSAPDEEHVIFTYNATYAINTAIKCFIKSGSHVLISDIEHNAVYRPVIAEALKGRICYSTFSTFDGKAESILADIERKTRYNTSAIIVNGASNIFNMRLPLEAIGRYAKKRNLLFIVDASQLAGHESINMARCNISLLCAPGHKGLYGPQGTGILVIGEGVRAYNTLIEGGSGYNSKDIRMPSTLPEMFEAGTLSTPAIAGLCAGVEYIMHAGIDNVRDYEIRLGNAMRSVFLSYPNITVHGDFCDGGVFSVTSRKHSTEEFAALLDAEGIMVRSGFHCAPLAHQKIGTQDTGTVRFSLGIFNTENDIEVLDSTLKKLLK